MKGSGSWINGIQAGYNNQCSSSNATYTIVGSKVAKTSEESDLCYCYHWSQFLP